MMAALTRYFKIESLRLKRFTKGGRTCLIEADVPVATINVCSKSIGLRIVTTLIALQRKIYSIRSSRHSVFTRPTPKADIGRARLSFTKTWMAGTEPGHDDLAA